MKILDTNVAIDHLRGRPQAVALLEGLAERGENIVASEVVRIELLAGVRESERESLESFCEALGWLPVNEEIARAAGELAGRHRKSYQGIDIVDYIIAATTLALGGELLTTNVKHYPMLEGLSPAY